MDFLVRIASLVRKELLAVLRDKKSRLALIIPPIIQIAIFGYAATMNVTRVPYAVLDKDGGEAASQYIADLEGTGIFQRQATAATEKDIDRMIDNREIVVGLTIPPDFSRNIQTGRPASLQLIADGRNTNTAAIALSYGQQIASAYGADLLSQNGGSSPVEIESRAWFNPNLITRWFIVPGLIAVLVLINSILSGALSIAREREEGTFDQLLVAPYTPGEILLGKGTASVITGIIQAVFVVLVAMFWFRIPFQGSIWLLSAALLLFIVTAAAHRAVHLLLCSIPPAGHCGNLPAAGAHGHALRLRHAHLQHAGNLSEPHAAQPHEIRAGTHPAYLSGRSQLPGSLAPFRGHHGRYRGGRPGCRLFFPSQNFLTPLPSLRNTRKPPCPEFPRFIFSSCQSRHRHKNTCIRPVFSILFLSFLGNMGSSFNG